MAEGWSPVGSDTLGRFALRPSVDLLLPIQPNGAQAVLTYAQPSTVTYHYGGQSLGQQSGTVHTLNLPPGINLASPTRLTLRFDNAPASLADLVSASTPIGSTGFNLAPGVAILAQSAGEEVGDFAHIWINGVDYAYNELGYNLVAMTPTGEVLDRAVFDTMTTGKSAQMAAWLDGWGTGTLIVGAVADSVEGIENDLTLHESAILALQRLGVAGDLRSKHRWSHAFVGVVGAPQGSAVEDIQAIRPAALWLGAPLPAPNGYGPLHSLTLTPIP